jgi:hypothetical protein
MNKLISFVIVLVAALSMSGTFPLAEEQIARMRDSSKLLPPDHFNGCNGGIGSDTELLLERCSRPSITNEAWEITYLTPTQLRTKYAFTVYTKQEIDAKVTALQTAVDKVQKGLEHNGQVVDDTKRAILLTIDRLPAQLPTNAGFYEQLRQRIKADISADLDKARSEVAPPPQ